MVQCDRCKQWGRGRHGPDICYLDILWPHQEPRNQPENLDISCMEVFHAMTGDKFWDCKREAGFNLFSAVGESVFSNLKLSLYIMASDESIKWSFGLFLQLIHCIELQSNTRKNTNVDRMIHQCKTQVLSSLVCISSACSHMYSLPPPPRSA